MDVVESLRVFVLIADQQSLSAVARSRGVSPSTVTLALQRLEERAQTTLINRTTRRLSLTPEGERLLENARRILEDIDRTLDKLAEDSSLSGDIRITTTNDLGRSRIAPLVDSFMAEHPRLRIQLMLTDAVVDLVQEGFDLGIRTGPLQDSRLKARLLTRGGRRICASPDYWARAGRPAHPRDLASHNCMVLARPGAPQNNWRFVEDEREYAVKVEGNRSANDGEALRRWALDGAGVVLKADWDIMDDRAAGRLESVLDSYVSDSVNLYAVYAAARPTPRRITAFVDHLVAAFGGSGERDVLSLD